MGRSTKADIQAAPQLWGALIALGLMLYDAYEGSDSASSAGGLAKALIEIDSCLDTLKDEISEVKNEIREITDALKRLPSVLAKIVSEQSYQDMVVTAAVDAQTAIETIKTFTINEQIATQNAILILEQLEVLHRSCNLALANRREFLDPHFAAVPYFSQWRALWGTAQTAMKSKDPNYIPIPIEKTGFYIEYSSTITKVIDNAFSVYQTTTALLSKAVLPTEGDIFNIATNKAPWERIYPESTPAPGTLVVINNPPLNSSALRVHAKVRQPPPSPSPSPFPTPQRPPPSAAIYVDPAPGESEGHWAGNPQIANASERQDALIKFLSFQEVMQWRQDSADTIQALQDVKDVRQKIYDSFSLKVLKSGKKRQVSLLSPDGLHVATIFEDDLGTQVWEDGECIRTGGPDRLDDWESDYIKQGWAVQT